jgi:hypothetical protein
LANIDFKKELKFLYYPPSNEVVEVEVPKMNYIMVEGKGDPNTVRQYKDALEALFGVSYALKFMVKRSKQMVDFAVMPLEGQWWSEDMARFSFENKGSWFWNSMIMQPSFVSESLFRQAVDQVAKKKNLSSLSKLRFESLIEGLCAQIMHLGPYAEEKSTVEKLHIYIKEAGYVFSGKHHEIYLSDPRKSAPEKMKTVIRQPISKEF